MARYRRFDLVTTVTEPDALEGVRLRRAGLRAVGSEAEESITVTPSTQRKCDRCWHWRADVGQDMAHPTLCGRCLANLFGAGEPRSVA